MKLRVGTRASPLAVTQCEQAMQTVASTSGGVQWELVPMTSTGDRIQDRPLRDAGGKGLFVKELDEALCRGHIDCAVHSFKDLPTDKAPGVRLAAVLQRADPSDVLLTRDGSALQDLPEGSRLGTTSLRRACQALAGNSGLQIVLLRGNVQTRLRRLLDADVDATFLARAGLLRLQVDPSPAVALPMDPTSFVPAPAQGALAITVRDDDSATAAVVGAATHLDSERATAAERAFAAVFGGGCHLPLAAYASVTGSQLRLIGLVGAPDGQRVVRDTVQTTLGEAEAAGEELGRSLLAQGADEILADVEAAL